MLRSILRDHVTLIKFTKRDGTERVLKGTLKADLLPPYEPSDRPRAENLDVVSVWDLENEGWRSFRYDSVIDVTIV